MTEIKPQNSRLGYARVSTSGQVLDARLEQFRADSCTTIFREKVTDARADRCELLGLLKALTPGNVLDTLAVITERMAGFRSLCDAWTDTTTLHGRLMLTVLGGLAEFESDPICKRRRSRTGESARREAWPQPKLNPHHQTEACRRRDSGKETLAISRAATTSATARFRA